MTLGRFTPLGLSVAWLALQAAEIADANTFLLKLLGGAVSTVVIGVVAWQARTTLANQRKTDELHVALYGREGSGGMMREFDSFRRETRDTLNLILTSVTNPQSKR